jgi:hypothetical protein
MRTPSALLAVLCFGGCGLGLVPEDKLYDDTASVDDDDGDDGGSGNGSGSGSGGDSGVDTGIGGSGSGSSGSGSSGSGSSGSGSSGSGSSGSGSSGSGSSGSGSSGSGSSGSGSSSSGSGSSGSGSSSSSGGGDPDSDGDGYAASIDCDDSNASMNWDDYDGDWFSTCDNDCDDYDGYTYPGAAWLESSTACMTDLDADGYGSTSPAGGVTGGTDCNDSSASVYPGAYDTEDDGVDQDCDGADATSGGGGSSSMTVYGTTGSIVDYYTNYYAASVTGCSNVSTLDVTVSLSHSYLGDIDIYIQEPGGAYAVLWEGLYDWDYYSTTISDTWSVTGATVGTGTWYLIIDDVVSADSGTLSSWSMALTCY